MREQEGEESEARTRVRYIAIARLEFLKKYNGSHVEQKDRKNAEVFYLKTVLYTYLRDIL